MRSDTLLTLAEFAEWLGISYWHLAQIDYDGSHNNRHKDELCEVWLEYEWQKYPDANSSKKVAFHSRSTLIRAMRMAENMFYRWTGYYPAPTQILLETHEHKPLAMRQSDQKTSLIPKCHPYLDGGIWTSTALETNPITLTREDSGILDEFTATFTVPDGTVADDVLIYLRADDAGYTGTPSPEHEIRPVRITIDGTDATLTAPAYLFVLPSHYAQREPERLLHDVATYVESVDVYIRSLDPCQHGNFVFRQNVVSKLPTTKSGLYLRHEHGSQTDFVVPLKVRCDESEALEPYTLQGTVHEFELNYIAGFPLVNRQMNPGIRDILCKIAATLVDYDEQRDTQNRNFDCRTAFLDRVAMYQEVPALRTANPTMLESGQRTGSRWENLVPEIVQRKLGGLPPMRGFVEAYQDLNLMNILIL